MTPVTLISACFWPREASGLCKNQHSSTISYPKFPQLFKMNEIKIHNNISCAKTPKRLIFTDRQTLAGLYSTGHMFIRQLCLFGCASVVDHLLSWSHPPAQMVTKTAIMRASFIKYDPLYHTTVQLLTKKTKVNTATN